MTYTLLTKKDCTACVKAKAILEEQGINYNVWDIEDRNNRWMITLMKGASLKTVPQVFASDGSLVGGYTELKELMTHVGEYTDE